MTRPSLFAYIAKREDLIARASDILGWVASGEVKVHIGEEFALADAATAQTKLAARQTTGKLILVP